MSEYMLLAYILVGALVFLIMCFGVVLILTAVDIIRKNYKEVKEDDPFSEIGIAE